MPYQSSRSSFIFQNFTFLSLIDEISGMMPSFSLDVNSLKIPNNVVLSDPAFYQSGDIDLLIGAQVYCDIICSGHLGLGPKLPILQKTRFDWIIVEPVPIISTNVISCNFYPT